jgi:hypothetical protein
MNYRQGSILEALQRMDGVISANPELAQMLNQPGHQALTATIAELSTHATSQEAGTFGARGETARQRALRRAVNRTGIVDDEHRIRSPHLLIGDMGEHGFQRVGRPRRRRHEVGQLLRLAGTDALGHRFDTFALAGAEQSLEIHRGPATLRVAIERVAIERVEKGREPGLEVWLPSRVRFSCDRSAHCTHSTANVSGFLHHSAAYVAE